MDSVTPEFCSDSLDNLHTGDIVRNAASHIHRPAYVEEKYSSKSLPHPTTPHPEFSSSSRASSFGDDRQF
jgi:hypothetical protein